MLLGLRLPAFRRGDHEHAARDAADAGEHVRQEAHVARDVDEAEAGARRQRHVSEPEVDRETASLLLRQPVGVGPRQRQHQRRTCRGRRGPRWRRRSSGRRRARTAVPRRWSASSSGSTARRSSIVAPSAVLAITGRRWARSAPAWSPRIFTPNDAIVTPGAEPAPGTACIARGLAPRPPPQFGGDPIRSQLERLHGRGDHAPERDAVDVTVDQGEGGLLEGVHHETSGTKRPRQRMPPAPLDEIGAPDDDARLRATEQLVAAERHDRRAGCDRLPCSRLAGQPGGRTATQPGTARIDQAAADVDDDRHRQRRQFVDRRLLDEAVDAVVARMDLEHDRRVDVGAGDGCSSSRRGGCGSWCPRRRGVHPTARSLRGPGTIRRSRRSRPCSPARRARTASAATTSRTAAALLLTTIADSAPHSVARSWPTAVWREPRSPVTRSNSTVWAPPTGVRPSGRATQVGVEQHPGGVDDRGEQTAAVVAGALLGSLDVVRRDRIARDVDADRVGQARAVQ